MEVATVLLMLLAAQYVDFGASQSACDLENSFTCRDGSCVSEDKRCNGLSDCLKNEDEEDCDFQKCGRAGYTTLIEGDSSKARIVGGEDADDAAWPWVALITRYTRRKRGGIPLTFHDNYVIGGGSLINNNWVLTAAHVFKQNYGSRIRLSKYLITLGITRKPGNGEVVPAHAQMFLPDKVLLYPNYTLQVYDNDIALIKLGVQIDHKTMRQKQGQSKGAKYTYFVRPVCLPCSGTVHIQENEPILNRVTNDETCDDEKSYLYQSEEDVVIIGFGNTRRTDLSSARYRYDGPKTLQQATLRVLDDLKCVNAVKDINDKLGSEILVYSNNYFCCLAAIPKKHSDSCQGDSGGPLLKEVSDNNTKQSSWVQLGIISFGYGCGLQIPGFYINVAKYTRWINSTITLE